VLYSGEHFFIMKNLSEGFMPAKNDGMVCITQEKASLPQRSFNFPVIAEPDETIVELISQVSTESLMGCVQHLENYVTRFCTHSSSVLAQNWLKEQYEALEDLDVSIHNFNHNPWWGGSVLSKNVIAIQPGTDPSLANEFIVCGAHYDSFSYDANTWQVFLNEAYGADDDATGTAGVLETARILSQYNFKRPIIYCAFSAEESGLNGSAAYAQQCASQGMNILGYFNLDMTGYLTPGDPIHFCLIYPNNPALALANYFVNISEIYFPTVPVTRHTNLPWGDSDHTSFSNKGIPGIWWFEDINCDCPYIHHIPGQNQCGNGCTGTLPCPGDKIGPSVNNPEQVKVFTQALVACIATLAEFDGTMPPPLPVPDFEASETTIVEGSNVQFTDLSTNSPTGWHWYFEGGDPEESAEQHPEVLYAVAGSYDVKLVVSNESGSAEKIETDYITVTLPPPPPPIADFTADAIEIEEDDAVTFTNLSQNNPESYSWHFDGGDPQESNEENPAIVYPAEGVYSVSLTVANENGEDTKVKENYITVKPKTGITDISTDSFRIFPNPANDELNITGNIAPTAVRVYNITGQLMYETTQCTTAMKISVSSMSAGVYFVEIEADWGNVTRKIIIE
jgi:PKD repeat protein